MISLPFARERAHIKLKAERRRRRLSQGKKYGLHGTSGRRRLRNFLLRAKEKEGIDMQTRSRFNNSYEMNENLILLLIAFIFSELFVSTNCPKSLRKCFLTMKEK